MERDDAMVTADNKDIVRFKISQHLRDLGLSALANPQRRVSEIGR